LVQTETYFFTSVLVCCTLPVRYIHADGSLALPHPSIILLQGPGNAFPILNREVVCYIPLFETVSAWTRPVVWSTSITRVPTVKYISDM